MARIEKSQDKISALYSLRIGKLPDILCIHVASDEARGWLWSIGLIGSAPFSFLGPFAIGAMLFAALVLVAYSLWAVRSDLESLGFLALLSGFWQILNALGVILLVAISTFIIIGILVALLVTMIQLVAVGFSLLVQGNILAFGWEGPFSNWLLRMRVSAIPALPNYDDLEYKPLRRPAFRFHLNHTLYQQEFVVQSICNWIAVKVAQSRPGKHG
jgi:hypothetical protein